MNVKMSEKTDFFVVGVFLIGLTAAQAGLASKTLPTPRSSDQLTAVPHPQLSRLEPAAREQILEVRRRLESIAEARDVPGEKLSQAYGEMGKLLPRPGIFWRQPGLLSECTVAGTDRLSLVLLPGAHLQEQR